MRKEEKEERKWESKKERKSKRNSPDSRRFPDIDTQNNSHTLRQNISKLEWQSWIYNELINILRKQIVFPICLFINK